MCGIFGIISNKSIGKSHLESLALHSRQRGSDSSGLAYYSENEYKVFRADYNIMRIIGRAKWVDSNVVMGHSRLITNGFSDNQPVVRDGMFLIHNGIIVNEDEIWESLNIERKFQIDSETIIAIALKHLDENREL